MTLRKSARLPRDLWEEAVFFVLQTARVSKFIEIVYYIIETRLRLTVLRRKIFAKDSRKVRDISRVHSYREAFATWWQCRLLVDASLPPPGSPVPFLPLPLPRLPLPSLPPTCSLPLQRLLLASRLPLSRLLLSRLSPALRLPLLLPPPHTLSRHANIVCDTRELFQAVGWAGDLAGWRVA